MSIILNNIKSKNDDIGNCFDTPSEKSQRSKMWRDALKNLYKEYCLGTSIHGIRYFGENRPFFEKLFWIIVFILSIYTCLGLIQNIWAKWDETPVIVSFSEKSTPVWQIPFPGITICPETKYEKSEKLNFTKFYNILLDHDVLDIPQNLISSDEFDNMRALLQVCGNHLVQDMQFPFYKKIDYLEKLNNITPDFQKTYYQCKWRNKRIPCENLFYKTYTEDGICYTMNGLNSSELFRKNTFQYLHYLNQKIPNRLYKLDWYLQGGYKYNAGADTYPRRVLGSGVRSGIFIALQNFERDLDFICRGPVQGFKVLLHPPDDVPQVSKHYFRVPLRKEMLVWVKPNMITTSKGISNYLPSRRQCFFETERYLQYFTIYTQNNCELECLTNHTLKRCGCVKFSMPRTPDMNVCDESKILCLDQAEDELLRNEFAEGVVDSKMNFRGHTKCNCLPSCTSLTYNTETSQADFDLFHLLEAYNYTKLIEENPDVQMSRLAVFFKENQFITSKRSELYGVTDFLANVGGLFGLFLGTSILSFIELFYYLTFRIWNNFKHMYNLSK